MKLNFVSLSNSHMYKRKGSQSHCFTASNFESTWKTFVKSHERNVNFYFRCMSLQKK